MHYPESNHFDLWLRVIALNSIKRLKKEFIKKKLILVAWHSKGW